MKAIIIAAGSGKRIPQFTKKKPKCLIKIKKNIYAIKGKFDWTEFDTQDDFKLYDKESK